jgi:hypothetical protein
VAKLDVEDRPWVGCRAWRFCICAVPAPPAGGQGAMHDWLVASPTQVWD